MFCKLLKKLIFVQVLFLAGNSMATECVVLIHGFGRTSHCFKKMSANLEDNGYKTIAIDYPSRSLHVFQLAEQFILPQIQKEAANCSKVHFVGYSMGGIIIRYILSNHRPKNLGRVVFVATPNSGAEVINAFTKYTWFQTIFGPAVQDISVGSKFMESLPDKVDYETGVISGNFSINPFTSLFILPGEDDGTVSVESTKIKGMKDQITVHSAHRAIVYNEQVIEETFEFIRNGKFRH